VATLIWARCSQHTEAARTTTEPTATAKATAATAIKKR
jgi:hypothetical protein